jgi:putative pyruvate formate lyase activating enzyme
MNSLPLVYNTSAYDSADSLVLMDGIVDIYMPDFKFWDSGQARRYAKAPDYPETAQRAIREMHRQVGPLVTDEQGVALRGVLLRHLVMPGGVAGTPDIMQWIARELGAETYVNLMALYHPACRVSESEYPEIDRSITGSEFRQASTRSTRRGCVASTPIQFPYGKGGAYGVRWRDPLEK